MGQEEEATYTSVTFEFYKNFLPELTSDDNKQKFAAAAMGLGVDSTNYTFNTATGAITFFVTPTAASNIENNVCNVKKSTSGYFCYLSALKDAEGTVLCDNLNPCNLTIEKPNVPVTFEFRKNFLLDLVSSDINKQAFAAAAMGLGVDSLNFTYDTTSGAITFFVTPTAASNIENNVCSVKKSTSGYFCYLSALKNAEGTVLCGDLNPCNKTFDDEPPQVVTVSIYFEDAPFDFDALYYAVGRLSAGSSGNSSSSSPTVVKITLDETGRYFSTVIINVTVPFSSPSSPLLTAICSDSPLM